MSKVFIWLFGAISGVFATTLMVGACVAESPETVRDLGCAFTTMKK